MARVRRLTDDELAEHIAYELKYGREQRRRLRVEWDIAEFIYQGVVARAADGGMDSEQAIGEFWSAKSRTMDRAVVNSSHLARAMHFLISKLAIVEPDVVTRPFTREWPDKKASHIGQLVIEHFKRALEIQDKLEQGAYVSLAKRGTCVTYQGWDPDAGSVRSIVRDGEYYEGMEFQPDTDAIDMTGDFEFRTVNCENFFIDSTAKRFEDANCCIEEMWIPAVKLRYMLNNLVDDGSLSQEKADKVMADVMAARQDDGTSQAESGGKKKSNAAVPVYFYWERAKPWNGMDGTFVFFVETDVPASEDCDPGTIVFLERSGHPYDHKELPYGIATDLPIEDSPFGMSRAIHAAQLHDMINQMYSMVLDNVELHGGVFLVAPEGSTNNAIEKNDRSKILTYNPSSGGQIYHLKPSNVATDIWKVVDDFKKEIDAFFGQGEFSRGEIPRELSSYAVQLGIEMDDKYRIILFNSKKKLLRRIYTQLLSLAKQYVTEERMLNIVGNEFIYEEPYFKGADLEGDYDVDVQFGKYMPVDPSARKQMVIEIINNGAFEKAGGDVKKLFKILLDGDMFDIVEVFDQARRIQEAEINLLLEGQDVPLQEWQEDSAHMEVLEDFMQTAFFEKLDEEQQKLVWAHYEKHSTRNAEREAAARKLQAESGGGDQGGGMDAQQLAAPGEGVPVEAGGAGQVPPM